VKKEPIILVVDDHAAVRRTLLDWLMLAMHPCQVLAVECGEEALTQVSIAPPDLVIIDISLPGIDGIQAAKKIKDSFSSVAIVMLSAHEGTVYQEEAARAGADAYVIKRKMRETLIPVLKQLLDATLDTKSMVPVE